MQILADEQRQQLRMHDVIPGVRNH